MASDGGRLLPIQQGIGFALYEHLFRRVSWLLAIAALLTAAFFVTVGILFNAALVVVLVKVCWAARLWRLNLTGRYLALFVFLLVTSGLEILMQVLNSAGESSYFYVYKWTSVASKPVHATLMFCVLAEAYSCIVERYRGFYRLAQIFIYAASGSAGALFLVMSVLQRSPEQWLAFWHLQERNIYAALLVFSLLVILFVIYFRLAVFGNLRIILTVFSLSIACSALLLTANELGLVDVSREGTQLNSILHLVFMSFGLLRFSAAGELSPRPLLVPESLRVCSEAASTKDLVHLNEWLTSILRS